MALENILPLLPAPTFTLQTEKGSEWQLSTVVLASGLAGANSMKGCNLGDFPHTHTFLPTVPWTLAREQPRSGGSGLKTLRFPRELGRISGGGQHSRLCFQSAEQKRA